MLTCTGDVLLNMFIPGPTGTLGRNQPGDPDMKVLASINPVFHPQRSGAHPTRRAKASATSLAEGAPRPSEEASASRAVSPRAPSSGRSVRLARSSDRVTNRDQGIDLVDFLFHMLLLHSPVGSGLPSSLTD